MAGFWNSCVVFRFMNNIYMVGVLCNSWWDKYGQVKGAVTCQDQVSSKNSSTEGSRLAPKNAKQKQDDSSLLFCGVSD